MNNSKRIISHGSVYLFGDLLRYSVSLIMLPIYTRYLTPEDYGTVELLSMLIDFAAILFGARVGQSVFRFYCSAKSESEKKSIISSALLLGFVFNGAGALAVILFSEQLALLIFSDAGFKDEIILFTLTMFMLPLIEIPLVHIRADKKPWLFFSASLIKLLLQLSLNIYFVVYKNLHVEGVIYSAVISSTVMAALLTGRSLLHVGFNASIKVCKKLFGFSLPIKIATIGSFYLAFGDRYILNQFTDLTQVGLYALGYKFGFIFMLLSWTPFEKIWDSEKYAIHKTENAVATYQKTFLYFNIIMITLGLCISLFVKDLLKIMSAPEFHSAYKIVPIIIFAYIFQAWSKYCDLGILLSKKTSHIAIAEAIAVVIITIAYLSLIPAYGIYGAAVATVIGFIVRFLWINYKGSQLYNMNLPWRKVIMLVTAASVCLGFSYLVTEDILLSISARMLILCVFIASVFTLPILSREEKQELLQKGKQLTKRFR
ncbi:MAG: oligosaccharide flippase family protein [Methylococcaceae bacterium]